MREMREYLGFTQDQMGDELGVTGSNISVLEKEGARNPTERTIQQIILKFHIREEWLRGGEGEMLEPEAPVRTEDEIKMIEAFRTLSDEMQIVVLNKIKEMVEMERTAWKPSPTTPASAEEPEYKKEEGAETPKITLQ